MKLEYFETIPIYCIFLEYLDIEKLNNFNELLMLPNY